MDQETRLQLLEKVEDLKITAQQAIAVYDAFYTRFCESADPVSTAAAIEIAHDNFVGLTVTIIDLLDSAKQKMEGVYTYVENLK